MEVVFHVSRPVGSFTDLPKIFGYDPVNDWLGLMGTYLTFIKLSPSYHHKDDENVIVDNLGRIRTYRHINAEMYSNRIFFNKQRNSIGALINI